MRTYGFLSVIASFLMLPAAVSAQEPVRDSLTIEVVDTLFVPEGYELADSIVYRQVSRVDTLLAGKSIFNILPTKAQDGPADVHVFQSSALVSAMMKFIGEYNPSRQIPGYRVRIFFDNRQTARVESEKMIEDFETAWPGVPAYRSYVNPYFKITVGDFRTKSEAMQFLRQIIGQFPKAFIVKEGIEYPAADKEHSVYVDTLKVLRPLTPEVEL